MNIDEQLLDQIGLSNIDQSRKQELTKQLGDLIQNQLALTLADRLDDEQLKKFEEVLEKEGEEAAMDYVTGIVPDYPQVVAEQVISVKQAFVNDMQMLLDHSEQNKKQ